MIKHWGEIETTPKEIPEIDLSNDIERSMQTNALEQYETEIEDCQYEHIYFSNENPFISYAISLHKYANDMSEKIRVAELAIESNLIPPKDVAPPILDIPPFTQKHCRNNLNFIPKDFTSFSLGEDVEVPEISETISKQVLIKSVATLCAHIGFETTHQSVLAFLTDVLELFYKTISQKLKIAFDDEIHNYSYGFPNIVERVLVQMGMGSCSQLHDYYQTRNVKYVNILKKRCEELNDHYEKLLVSGNYALNSEIKYKVEEESMEVESSEINPTDLESDVGLSSLETGFQLLNSLEAQSNLLDGGEELTSIYTRL